jgi:hypothetical protein
VTVGFSRKNHLVDMIKAALCNGAGNAVFVDFKKQTLRETVEIHYNQRETSKALTGF